MKSFLKGLCIIFLFCFLLAMNYIVYGLIDYNRIENNKKPIFSITQEGINDGGSMVYYGIGFQIIDWKTYLGDDEENRVYGVGREIHFFHDVDPADGPNVERKLYLEPKNEN